jgi:hypothetical protein
MFRGRQINVRLPASMLYRYATFHRSMVHDTLFLCHVENSIIWCSGHTCHCHRSAGLPMLSSLYLVPYYSYNLSLLPSRNYYYSSLPSCYTVGARSVLLCLHEWSILRLCLRQFEVPPKFFYIHYARLVDRWDLGFLF